MIEMSEQMRKVLHAFSALADLGEEISETADFEEMALSSLHVVLGALGIRRGAIIEADAETHTLKPIASRGYNDLAPRVVTSTSGRETNGNGSNGHKVHFTNVSQLLERAEDTFRDLEPEVIEPLLVHGELIGVILLGGKASGEAFTQEDRDLVRALGRHIGVGLANHRLIREVESRAAENLRLYDELRGLYRDTVRAFAAAIDCKDKYTQGHSERVGKYSEIIARELGWSEEEIEGIAIAGYLHDIGKLVVDRDIINAPYKIDAKQSSELNRHPAAGYEILKPIQHPYADLPLMARYHHERPDGRGYPEGLCDEQIPLSVKIVSLADSFDAMTTDRPYRRRRVFGEVVADLRRNAGKQFSVEVVVALCRALLKEARGERRPRQMIKLLGKDYLEDASAAAALENVIYELESGMSAAAGQA